jgi:ATP-dependent 26S proteasome regulatory subunit
MVAAVENLRAASWLEANHAYLQTEMRRLRLLFARKVRWLRWNWQQDPLGSNHQLVISDALADRHLRGDDEIEELRFYSEDGECVSLTAAVQDIEAELAQLRSQLTEDGGIPALESLARLFGLSSPERDLLLLCFAIEDDPSFATLCAYVHDDATACYVTQHLAVSLLHRESTASKLAYAMFLPNGRLRCFKLITIGDGGGPGKTLKRPLGIDERIADYLRGVNRFDERIVPLLRVISPAAASSADQQVIEKLISLAGFASGQSLPPFHLSGAARTGRETVAKEFCARVGLELYALDASRLPSDDRERHHLLHLMEREAVLSSIALYFDLNDIDPTDRSLNTAIHDWIESYAGPLFVSAPEVWQFRRPVFHVEVQKLEASDQQEVWTRSLQGVTNSVDGQIEAIVQQFDFESSGIMQALNNAITSARLRNGDFVVTADDLWQACGRQVTGNVGPLAQRLSPCYSWDDIVLPAEMMRQLREIADQVATRSQVYGKWGFGARLTRGRGISALFSGPSGTGKTMAAEILARHLKLDLYRIDLAGVVSKYLGESEKNLRTVFDAAEQSGAILLFDEADALFGKRTEVRDSHDRYANIEVNYLLQRMEEYRGLAILCTNRRAALDRAFLRRLRFLVEFPFPDPESRRLIWQKSFPPQAQVEPLDLEVLSRLEISGGNIHNIVLNGAFLAAAEQSTIGMRHLLRAARREYSKIDKLLTESEFGLNYNVVST